MADLIPDPTQKGMLAGHDLKSARDALQEKIISKTTWCLYAYCAGCGVDGLDLPCCFCVGEVCCCGGVVRTAPCWDQDGCLALSSKCCCCISGIEIPPDNTPGIGCGPARCLSNIEGRTPEECTSQAAKNELDTYQKTLWCWACYFCFEGLTYDVTPVCQQEGKCCCLWVSLGSAPCWGDDGCVECSGKGCCCVVDGSIPAGYTPGFACCGVPLCYANMPPAAGAEEGPVQEL